MIKKGFITTGIFIISTCIQLISQIVVTRIYGASLSLDIFLAAVAVPTIIVTVIYATLNDAFLPLLAQRKHDEKETYLLSHIITLTTITFFVSLIISIVSDPLSALLYGQRGIEFVHNVSFQIRYLFLSIPVSVAATLLGSYFYERKDFIRFPFAQLLGSAINLLIIYYFAPIIGIWALVSAFVINIVIQIFFIIPRKIFSVRFIFASPWQILIAWTPLIIGNIAMRSDTLLVRSFAVGLPDGYLVYLNLVVKVFSLATSVATIGIQVLLLPHIIEYFNDKNYTRLFITVRKAKIGSILVSMSITMLLLFIAPFFITLLFVGGKFTAEDALVTNKLLPLFVLPSIGWGINTIFMQPLIALKKQYVVGALNVLAMILGFSVGYVTKLHFGPLFGILTGLTTLIFSGIIGSEFVWQYYKNQIQKSQSSS